MPNRPVEKSDVADNASSDHSPAAATRKHAWWRRRWPWRVLFWAALIGIPSCVKLDHFFYYPDRVRYFEPREFCVTVEDVYFTTRDGVRLHGWWLPAMPQPASRSSASQVVSSISARSAPAARGTVVHFHGNAANITNHIATVYWLPPEGYNVLMFDYRGYGRSEGRVTRAGTIADGHAALDYVLSRPDVDPARVLFYGQSLGGAIAIVVAADRPEVRSVVAEQTFGNYRALASRHLQNRVWLKPLADAITWLVISKGHDPVDVVRKIAPRPLLVISSDKDTICYESEGRKLFEAAAEPKEYWCAQGAHHYGILEVANEMLKDKVLRLLSAASDGEQRIR